MGKQDRTTLRAYFETGKRPTQQQFTDLIDSMINIEEDGISANAGNIGIGTETPENTLDVAGDIGIDDYIRHNGDNDTYIGFSDDDTIQLSTGGTERLTVDQNGNVGIGTTSPTARLEVAGNLAISGNEVINSAGEWVGSGGSVPQGGIIMWSGNAGDIPGGWALCDGTNNTPDLRQRFVVGAGGDNPDVNGGGYNAGDYGGLDEVTLTTAQMPSHTHTATDNGHTHGFELHQYNSSFSGSGGSVHPLIHQEWGGGNYSGESHTSNADLTINNTGEGAAHENRPPYYALCFIIKL